MRELSFYAQKYYKNDIDNDMKNRIEILINIRNAICHRSSEKNWLSGSIKIQGALLFRTTDAEIQYGQYQVKLIGDVIGLYQKLRNIFLNSSSEFGIKNNSYTDEMEEKELKIDIDKLSNSIQEFEKNLKNLNCSSLNAGYTVRSLNKIIHSNKTLYEKTNS